MQEFPLRIVTPRGEKFNGTATSITLRSVVGDVCIRARHADYITVIDIGRVTIQHADGKTDHCACTSGYLSVRDGTVSLVVAAFEFSDQIDIKRALDAKERAEHIISTTEDEKQMKVAQLKLKRALNRLSLSERKK